MRMLPLESEDQALTGTIAHHPVLLEETIELLAALPGETVADLTLGGGGHAQALLEAIQPGGRLIGVDRDPVALEQASRRLERFGESFRPMLGNHREMLRLMEEAGIDVVDRILIDLGLSSIQLDNAERGFSFREDGPLDMRMGPDAAESAADLLARLSEEELADIFWRYGEERRSRAIARAVVRERAVAPVARTGQLARLVERVLGPSARKYKIHPATRTFLSLRVAVNRELDGLEIVLADAVSLLRPGGRLAVISFHSLEDRIVKNCFKALADRCTCPPRLPVCGCGRQDLVRLVTKRPVPPSDEEVQRNPRSRSAKLRVVERL